jgi:hypothetical protein
LAEGLEKLRIGPGCGDIIGEELLVKSGCMRQWAVFRREGGQVPEPSCDEPQGYADYPVNKELRRCRLGVVTADATGQSSVDPSRVTVELPLSAVAELGTGLVGYADSLTEIVASADTEALQSSVGAAKTAILNLNDTIDGATGQQVVERDTFSPVADLVGSALIAGFEQRRFNALKRVVKEADPVITDSAQYLSRVSMVLLIPRLVDKITIYENSIVDGVNKATDAETYKTALAKARLDGKAYTDALDADPASAFKRMGEAHTALKQALEDPEGEFEHMKQQIELFLTQAEAVQAAVKADKEDKEEK